MKTYSAKAEDVARDWYVVDAADMTLGRLASAIAHRLRGKHKAEFTPHVDTGDYIELAKVFHTVLISGVPEFDADKDDQARRFISLVDEFYDRNVKLVLAAATPLLALYAGGKLEFEFQRTISRLQEMQSFEYLAREHRP